MELYPEKGIARLEEELRKIEALEKVEGKVVLLEEYRPGRAERLAGMPRM